MYQDDLTKKLAEAVKKITDNANDYTHRGGKGHEDFVDLHTIDDKDDPEQEKQTEEKGDKEEYQKFFQSALKKFGVKSPAELDGDKEKEFYNYVDDNWKSDMEESVEIDEAFIDIDAADPSAPGLAKLLKKNKVKMKIVSKKGPNGFPLVKLTGTRKDLEKVLSDPKDGWDDADLGEFIEEGND